MGFVDRAAGADGTAGVPDPEVAHPGRVSAVVARARRVVEVFFMGGEY
jgi:hypothetical protein